MKKQECCINVCLRTKIAIIAINNNCNKCGAVGANSK